MYLGEIARLIIAECACAKQLFGGKLSTELKTPNRFYTKYISEIEECVLNQFVHHQLVFPCPRADWQDSYHNVGDDAFPSPSISFSFSPFSLIYSPSLYFYSLPIPFPFR